MSDIIRLQDAGVREREWAAHLVSQGKFPTDVTAQDLYSHAMYNPHTDCITINLCGITHTYKVNRG